MHYECIAWTEGSQSLSNGRFRGCGSIAKYSVAAITTAVWWLVLLKNPDPVQRSVSIPLQLREGLSCSLGRFRTIRALDRVKCRFAHVTSHHQTTQCRANYVCRAF
jgi:hypothetical protein